MNKTSPQKMKLLIIWEILQKKTDRNHQMTTNELICELADYNISCERRTLYKDIELLRSYGYEIIKGHLCHENTYYVNNRQFNISEIKIVMDAIQSASFIPEKKTAELLDKLAALGGCHRAELLKRNTIQFQTVKHNNDDIYNNIKIVESALEKKRMLKFNYFHLNEHNEKIYTNNKTYTEQPLGMILDDGNYYLLCYRSEKEYVNNVKIFRFDRIDNIEIYNKKICKEADFVLQNLNKYRLQAFKMYTGEIQNITLQFKPELIEVIYDKFGHDVKIYRSENICRVSVKVQISPTFWGWMLQFPTSMKIYAPENLKQKYNEWVHSALEN